MSDLAPIGSDDETGDDIGKESQRQPFQDVGDLVVAEMHRGQGDRDAEENDEIMRINAGQHFRGIGHAGEIGADVDGVGNEQSNAATTMRGLGISYAARRQVPAPVTMPMRAHIICTLAISGQVIERRPKLTGSQ